MRKILLGSEGPCEYSAPFDAVKFKLALFNTECELAHAVESRDWSLVMSN